jgi:hypothetical protein
MDFVPTIVRTLLSNGFRLIETVRKPSYLALTVRRIDEFGVANRYLIGCIAPTSYLHDGDVEALQKLARLQNAALVVVGTTAAPHPNLTVLSQSEFLDRLGGPVTALLPLEPEYANQLQTLGHNQLPSGLSGKSDDLFEEYVHAGLQFLFQERVLRYGQERRFEAVPDGYVPGRRAPLMLYDAKAAKDGYDVSTTTVRQFADYVTQFHQRYETYTGRLYCFLAISGHFQAETTLHQRDNELYASCGVPLRFITAGDLSRIVTIFAEHPTYRGAIDWKTVFATTMITAETVNQHLNARLRDRIIPQ